MCFIFERLLFSFCLALCHYSIQFICYSFSSVLLQPFAVSNYIFPEEGSQPEMPSVHFPSQMPDLLSSSSILCFALKFSLWLLLSVLLCLCHVLNDIIIVVDNWFVHRYFPSPPVTVLPIPNSLTPILNIGNSNACATHKGEKLARLMCNTIFNVINWLFLFVIHY